MKPQLLPPNVLRHFYAGGARIAALRGLELDSDHMPEEWLGAANTTFGDDERGLSRLADGTLVRDAIQADPEGYLGPEHVARFGPDPALLVKLLDAGQRLPVHFHPGRPFAREALGSRYGKTEAWWIVEAEPGAAVHVGFERDIELRELSRVDAYPGRRRDARLASRARGLFGRRGVRPRGHAARHRRGHPDGRAAGADRHVGRCSSGPASSSARTTAT